MNDQRLVDMGPDEVIYQEYEPMMPNILSGSWYRNESSRQERLSDQSYQASTSGKGRHWYMQFSPSLTKYS